MSLRDCFPFKNHDGSPAIRPGQEQALATIEQALKDGKRYIIIEAPTGVGKSGIAMAVANWAAKNNAGSYILSTQKTLTAQYMEDFGEKGRTPCNLIEMRGRSNFSCCIHDGQDCKTGNLLDCRESRVEEIGDKTVEVIACPYTEAKRDFIGGSKGVTNFAYFLAETAYVGALPERKFLIVDECHNVEKEILNFAGFEITHRKCEDLGAEYPPIVEDGNHEPVIEWLNRSLLPRLDAKIQFLTLQALRAQEPGEKAKLKDWAMNLDALRNKLLPFVAGEMADWIVYSDEDNDRTQKLIFKPFTPAEIAQKKLFRMGQVVILMSATILDTKTFMRNLGIPESDAVSLKLDSDFPVENRPVYAVYAGNMNRDTIDRTLPKLVRKIEEILDQCPDKKGILHCHSYKVTQAVVGYLKGTKHGYRLLTHTSAKGSREAAIEAHKRAGFASILVSPSMFEGLDLKGDLSRIQIICKVPYPALDPYITARKNRDPQWYLLQAGLALIQASGRSVRSRTDWAMTVILDQGFHSFFVNNSYLLSPWWTKSVRVLKAEDGIPKIREFFHART